ncbi:hypothetical protein [Bartonella saheliensis]|uniref:hypothetical protein n=1 Tax=Bartonella saheliensis TaxID=1457016 RepID=UPI001FE90C44|nr:hypothetical protein [Bartonella saheliensis]
MILFITNDAVDVYQRAEAKFENAITALEEQTETLSDNLEAACKESKKHRRKSHKNSLKHGFLEIFRPPDWRSDLQCFGYDGYEAVRIFSLFRIFTL